ncbi:hypothetical protein ACFUMJ_18175 [Streptomyces olivaceus]|uniref:hypothetical protein n=1 Tax=Streptomyces TaxID=1883 RepID=UPI001FB6AC2D|nr:hypothetical protein [Streptomyces sp. CB09030]UOG83903.1 hypothetical protein L6J92_34175 [Streptomyces sp. CB09030]
MCDRLPEDRLAEWEEALEQAGGPEDPVLWHFAASQTAAGTAERLRALIGVWRSESPGLSGAGLVLALRTARAAPRPLPALPVVSGPVSVASLRG